MRILVVGSGFSGAVVARQLADALPCRVEVWEERDHLGGNCHTERDGETGVMVHRYGPHVFNTDDERVWEYVRRFGDFRPFVNRVKAVTSRGVFTMPINLLTINQFFGTTFCPAEAEAFVRTLGDGRIGEPANFEEQVLKSLGRDLYETFFRGYTIKQWGCDPKELPASVVKRLPVRFNYDDNYYDKRFQGIPAEGYTDVIRRILDHPSIVVRLRRPFTPHAVTSSGVDRPSLVVHTGPIDAYFGHAEGRLGYRTVTFERIVTDARDHQGTAVINYTDLSVPWTRIHEHKHLAPWERHERTVVFREYSAETNQGDMPFYPKRLAADRDRLARYRARAEAERRGRSAGQPGVSFLGRLATYRYMDMETVVGEALSFADRAARDLRRGDLPPVFPNAEA